MDCKLFAQQLDAMLDGELLPVQQAEMRQHMKTCASCSALYDSALDVLALSAQACEAQVPEGFTERVMDAIRKEAVPKPKRKWYARGSTYGFAGVAACFVIVVALLAGNGGLSSLSSEEDAARSQQYNDFSAMSGGAGKDADVTEPLEYPEPEMLVADDGSSSNTFMPPSVDAGDPSQYGQKIITSGYINLETTAFDTDLELIEQAIASYGGYVQNTSVSGRPLSDTNNVGRYSNYTIRVPSENYKAAVEAVRQYGVVLNYSENADDITSQYYDTQARLEAYQLQYDKIKDLLVQAETLEDILRIEEELSRLQYQIDSYTGTIKGWDNRVNYSTLNINVQEVRNPSVVQKVDPTLGERIRDGFVAGINGIVRFLENAVVWFASSLIWLILLAALVVVAVIVIRNNVRKRKKA